LTIDHWPFRESSSWHRKKNFFVFDLAFAGRNVTSGGVFAFSWPILFGPGPQPIDPFFWLKFFSETRSKCMSLEPLNGFLEYLQPKLWIKIQKLVNISAPTSPNVGGIHLFSIWPTLASGSTYRAVQIRSVSGKTCSLDWKNNFHCAISAFLAMFTKSQDVLTSLSKQSMTSTSRGSSKIEPIQWRETARSLNALWAIVWVFEGFGWHFSVSSWYVTAKMIEY